LSTVGYDSEEIGLSALLDLVDWSTIKGAPDIDDETLDRHIETRMEAGNCFREALDRGDALALLAIFRISRLRTSPLEPRPRHAYILRSLKHPDEVDTLREVYGPHFFLVSAYAPVDARAAWLTRRIQKDWERKALTSSDASAEGKAWDLIERDRLEAGRTLGQQLGATFPKADLFVDARRRTRLESEIERFVELLFGHPFRTPTQHENAMFHAQAAALRSSAPSRQVGAVITTPTGEIIAVGTNEVPKAGGGQYWPDDKEDHRDHNRDDPDVSGSEKRTVVEQILARLKEAGWLSKKSADSSADDFFRLTEGLRIQDLIEFERVVHAEMSAITDAARRGVKVQDAYLYTTTFPCHECTRHLIGAGIHRLFYIQPYPKSLAARLHDDSVEIDRDDPPKGKLRFEPFVGVAPRRYLELFTAGPDDRKKEGQVQPPQPGWFPKVLPPTPPPAGGPESAGADTRKGSGEHEG